MKLLAGFVPSIKIAPLALAAALLFSVSPLRAQIYTPLHTYTTGSDNTSGIHPAGLLSQGQDGNVYGTISSNGNGSGTVFQINLLGQFTPIYTFCQQTGCLDGQSPLSGVTLGTDGNFYGTAAAGGKSHAGTAFKVTPSGTLTKLWDFTFNADGGNPWYPPFQAPDGNFYGVVPDVYVGEYGLIYKLSAKTPPPYKFTQLADLAYTNGLTPNLPTFAVDGNFYGTTRFGGDARCGCGVIYKMTPSGRLTVLHKFTGYPNDGNDPLGVLLQASDGNFYGTTYSGGAGNYGIVFKISPSGTYSVLYSFTPSSTHIDGGNPQTGLIQGTDGNLYGTTGIGGRHNGGVIYKISLAGQLNLEYNFCSATFCADGFAPTTPLIQHTDGKFYGNTSGNTNGGSVFYSLDMGLGPFASLVIWEGKVGSTVEILGQGFTGTSSVTFEGGVPATSFTVVSDTYLTAVVPAGALSGDVDVVTPHGTLISSHNYILLPAVTSIAPLSGAVGSAVTIKGTSFTGATQVTFGGGKVAVFTVNSDGQITATVPVGAKTGKIVVSTPSGSASSASTFTVL